MIAVEWTRRRAEKRGRAPSFVGLIALLCVVSCLWACQGPRAKRDVYEEAQKRGVLRIGTSFTPPLSYLDGDGNPQGFDVEYARLIAKDILGDAKAVKFVEVENANRLSVLNTRQVDFILSGFSITEERKKYFNFSKPYQEASFRILVRDDSGIKTKADLVGKRVCFLFGGTSEGILKRSLPKGVVLVGFHSVLDEMQAYRTKQIDGFAQQDLILKVYMREHCGHHMMPEKLDVSRYAVAFEKSPQSKTMQDRVQLALNRLEKSGQTQKLLKKWYDAPLGVQCTVPD
jgi:ABC-type amino acid transport substrate-binding protein